MHAIADLVQLDEDFWAVKIPARLLGEAGLTGRVKLKTADGRITLEPAPNTSWKERLSEPRKPE